MADSNGLQGLPPIYALYTFLIGLIPGVLTGIAALWKRWDESRGDKRKSVFDETERLIELSEKITERYQSELAIVNQQLAADKEKITLLVSENDNMRQQISELKATNEASMEKIRELTHRMSDTSTAMRSMTNLVREVVTGSTLLYNQVIELGGEPVYTPPSQKG